MSQATAAESGGAPQPGAAGDAAAQHRLSNAFLQEHCVDCHGEEKQKGKFRVDDLIAANRFDPADGKRWQNILEMVDIGDMPPSKRPQPADEEREAFETAVNQQLQAFNAGKSSWEKEKPRYANRVDHDALFSGKHTGPAYTESRVWRINGHIYTRYMGDLQVASHEISIPLQMNADGFKDYSSLYADETTIQTMMQNARRVAFYMIKGKPKGQSRNYKGLPQFKGPKHGAIKKFLAIEGEPTREQLNEIAMFILKLLTKLEPTPEQVERSVDGVLIPNIKAAGSNEGGLDGYIVAVLLSPEVLFRSETGEGEELPDGRRMLSPEELAFAISYSLHDRPIDYLIKEAQEGNLKTREDVEREFRKLYDDMSLEPGRGHKPMFNRFWPAGKVGHDLGKPRLIRFFREYFGYTKALDVFKDDLRGGASHNPDQLVKDADWTILAILLEDKNVLEQLLTTDRWIVDYNKKPKGGQEDKPRPVSGFAHAYNLTKWAWEDANRRMPMPEGQRVGMLTHPAWLVAHSQNFHTDPVRRGKWILGHLLGQDVPELPIAVQAQLPEWHDKTIRERFSVVKDEDCWRCHKKMNPLGGPFEAYDDFGRHRTMHFVGTDGHIVEAEFETKNRKNPEHIKNAEPKIPVDTTGELMGTGDSKLDGPVEDVSDLMHRLAKSERVRQVFIRHMFRYWMGRNETLNDSPTLMAMDKAYLESEGSLKETLVALVTSDSFLYRK